MRSIDIRLRVSALLILALLLPAASFPEAGRPSGGFAGWIEVPELRDGIAPEQFQEIRSALEAWERQKGMPEPQTGADEAPLVYPFFPQAGLLGQDLFLTNFTDLEPLPNAVLDWDCTNYTYDGHRGHDSLIRSFREQAIGVPVFAALDGIVVETHDGEPDQQTEWNPSNLANFVAIDHGGGYTGLYYHLKRDSVAVVPGQTVTAGTQIGLTGSSGISDWPHLHFESWKDRRWFEPSAGPCRPGDSFWASQPPVVRNLYVADFYMTRGDLDIPDFETLLHDPAERAGGFLQGFQRVSQRVDLRNLPEASTFRMRVVNPRRKTVLDISDQFGNRFPLSLGFGLFSFDLNLDVPGTWRFQLDVNGARLVDAPFQVGTNPRQIANRPPNRITVRLDPPRPQVGKVMTCAVRTSLISEDPDFDIVSYRYEWKVNGRPVRSVTSAALTDLLPAGTAQPKDRVTCRVVPSDGRRRGQAAIAALVLEER
ncbi:MAG TPA: M23 family metallopeptidase [Thermoanaerobaculia bacterium]|nr:M23 family metallopeptidase [Thermoanaerobaculia bacterium]